VPFNLKEHTATNKQHQRNNIHLHSSKTTAQT